MPNPSSWNLYQATLQILASTVTGGKGQGLHDNDELIGKAVSLAKKTARACDDSLQAEEDERLATLAELNDLRAALESEKAAHRADLAALDKARAQIGLLTAPPVSGGTPPAPAVDPAIAAALLKAKDGAPPVDPKPTAPGGAPADSTPKA